MTMVDIARNPKMFFPLREEVIKVLTTDGLKPTALQKLKLVDSCLKESQRLKPIQTGKLNELHLHSSLLLSLASTSKP